MLATPARAPRTPARTPGTRGTLLSTVKRSGPRQSFDIDKWERVRVPRLPSLRLGTAPELDEDEELEEELAAQGLYKGQSTLFIKPYTA